MNPKLRLAAPILIAAMLAACTAGGGPRVPRTQIDRALASAPYAAQPSLVVAREIAFARAAREEGQWTAFKAFATDDAVLHGRNGPVAAKPVLDTLDDPETAVQWSPRTVMMSCDGKLAVSQGRFLDPEGFVGTFVTVWEREKNEDEYRWAYDVGGRDDPQPEREEIAAEEIVVTAYDNIQGLVADCPRSGSAPTPPALDPAGGAARGVQLSSDGTLRWVWEHRPDGTKYVRADYYTSGAWETVIDQTLASSPE